METIETIYCSGCGEIFNYSKYLSHIVGGYCSAHIENTNGCITGYTDGAMGDDEMSDEIDYENIDGQIDGFTSVNGVNSNYDNNNIDLYNPMINNGFPQTNQLDQLDQMMSTMSMGLGYIECYSVKIQVPDGTQCSICLDTYKDNIAYRMICSHIFCEACASRWFKYNCKCPECNQNLQDLLSRYS